MEHVGMDLGKARTQVAWLKEDGRRLEMGFVLSVKRLGELFGGKAPMKFLVEASTGSEWVARCLEEMGHEVIVADPNYALMYADRGKGKKNDRLDADALLTALLKGNYKKAHRVSDARRLERARLNGREALVNSRKNLINCLTATLWGFGVKVPSGSSCGFVKRVKGMELPDNIKRIVAPLLDAIRGIDAQVKNLEKAIDKSAAKDPSIARLMEMPGVGPVTASTFVATLDTPARFASANNACAFVGVVPRVTGTSDVVRTGSITKMGPTRLRCLLVQAAWCVFNGKSAKTQHLKDWALAVARRAGKVKAVVALTRRITRILFAMWRDGRSYEPHYPAGRDRALALSA